MSRIFKVDRTILWNPSNPVADLYKAQAEATAAAFNIESGMSPVIADECHINVPVFEKFLARLADEYYRTAHYVVRSLIFGVIGTSYVMLERVGGQLPAMGPEWPEVRAEYSRSMPA